MKEVITTPDGIKLTAQYRAVFQNRNMKKEGRCMTVTNPKRSKGPMSTWQLFDTADEAKAELAKEIKRFNKGARVETTTCGMIGIDLVIDEKDAEYMEIVYWEIQKRWVSSWEEIENSKA